MRKTKPQMKKYLCLMGLATVVACSDGPTANGSSSSDFTGFDPEWFDTDVDPCADFASYTSGGWKEQNPIPPSEGRWGSFNLLIEENRHRIRALLDRLEENEYPEGSYQQKIKDHYKTAIDTVAIEEQGAANLAKILSPYDELSDRSDLPVVLAGMKKRGITTPFSTYASPDDKNSGVNIFQISQSGLGLPDRDYYLDEAPKNDSIRLAYTQLIAAFLELAGIDNAEDKAQAILRLETSMAQAQMSRSERRDPDRTYNKMSADAFAALLPSFNVAALFGSIGFEGDTLLCAQPEYITSLNALFADEDLETWRAYLQWHTLRHFSTALPQAFRDASFDFYGRTVNGLESPRPRWKVAQSAVQRGQSESMGRIYVDEYFPEEYKNRIAEMVENIKATYGDRIRSLTWMSDETKVKALDKLQGFTYKIGYPDEWTDYSELKIGSSSLVDNMLEVSRYAFEENMAEVDQPVDKTEWFMGAHVVNAYYNPSFNEIVFPAGILQPPFFDPEADDAMNYGGIGGVIGHEFTHGFDDQGSKYDGNGNLSNWWTEEDRARFEELADRLVDQYNSFEALPGEYVNGRMTLGENIADLGGLTIAYHAYKKSREGKETIGLIDGMTEDQRVFLGWSGVWQIHYKDETLSNLLLTDYHAPGTFRIKGPLQNMPEFQQAWGCTPTAHASLPDSLKAVIW